MKNAYKPLVLALVIIGSIYLGSKLIPLDNPLLFSDSSVKGINKFNEILNYIEESYVDTIRKEELIEDGIQSMLRDLDPHSYYIPRSKYKEYNESIEGNFDGIGVEFRIIADTVMVITVVPNGPSQKAGLKAGDRIVKVNDTLIAGVDIRNSDVMKKLKGRRNTKVDVGIRRNAAADLLQFEIIRDKIPLVSVECEYMMDSKTGYVRVNRFTKTTYAEFKHATDKLLNQNMTRYVIDLRNNPGGLLNQSIKMANEFLKKDKLIVYTQGKARPKKSYYADYEGSVLDVALVVLLDEGSASASEVFAGAIQDNDRGYIVGRRSFGKGLVQEQVDWPDGSALRLTVARYYTPTGRSIQKPYKNVENYHTETLERVQSGELGSADSMPFFDTLKYYTPGGRVVYGGGGIVPDIFVPIDSLNFNAYYNALYRSQSIQNYSFRFADSRRQRLLKAMPTWKEFRENFKLNTRDFNEFIQFSVQSGVERNPRQVAIMKEKILLDLKAQIARNLYGDEGLYPILNEIDPVVKAAQRHLGSK